MINILIGRKNQDILSIKVSGHSGYAEAGSDIICSAVSTLTQNLILSLGEVAHITPIYQIDEDAPSLFVTLPELTEEDQEKAQLLMQSTVVGLKDLAKSYKKFIRIKEKQDDNNSVICAQKRRQQQ